MTKEMIVGLGNAKMKCPKCNNEFVTNTVHKYLIECIMRLQNDDTFVIRAHYNKLPDAEAILGILARFNVREQKRETKKIKYSFNGIQKEIEVIDITAKVV